MNIAADEQPLNSCLHLAVPACSSSTPAPAPAPAPTAAPAAVSCKGQKF